jgi:signal transduction histidine kinase
MEQYTANQRSGARGQLGVLFDLIKSVPQPAFVCGPTREIVVINAPMLNYLGISVASDMEFNNLGQFESLLGTRLEYEFIQNRVNADGDDFRLCFSNLNGELKHCRIITSALSDSYEGYWIYTFYDETRVFQLEERLKRKKSEMSIFSQVVSALGSSLSFEEILQIILIAVTAREGLGFNRAFLFLFDEKQNNLKGHIAVGPSSPEEAGRIWNSLPDQGQSLIEVLRQYRLTLGMTENPLNRMVRDLKIPLQAGSFHLDQVVSEKRGIIIRVSECPCGEGCDICSLLGVSEFAAVPMASGDRVLGVITADNHITSREISMRSLSQLQVFANQAAIAIERTRLYESLAENLKELETANLNLRHAQDELLKIERVSLWSELTYDIAHELRNPASIIGGFAALMLKSKQLPEPHREHAEIIYAECRRLEKALSYLLDFSKSFSPERSQFDLRMIVREVLDILPATSRGDNFRIDMDNSHSSTVVWGIRDQIKFAIYTVIFLLAERLQNHCKINISIHSADNNMKVLFEFKGCEKEVKALLNDFANPREGSLGLKLSMAFEALKYNGGNLGIESTASGRPGLYLDVPR